MFQGQKDAGVKARDYLIQQGYDGVNFGDQEYVAFYPEQIKSADPVTYDDNGEVIPLSQRFDRTKNDTRFSIDDGEAGFVEPVPFTSSIDDSRGKNIVAMLRPIVGMTQVGFDKEALARNIKERYGVDVSPAEALLWAREASRQNFVEHRRRQNKIRDEWLYENNLLWKLAVDYAGSENFKVRVSDRMNDRELSGTFWLKPGEKYSGTVVDLDALANEVARQTGRYRRSRIRPRNRTARLTAKAAITSAFPVVPPTILPVKANAPPAAIAAMAYRRSQEKPNNPQRTGTTKAPA